MNVEQVMTRNVASCAPRDSLNRAAQLMWECDCGCIPVIDDSGSVRGVVTDRDICMAAYTQGKPLSEIQVSSAMSPDLVFCAPGDSLDRAQLLMQRNRVRRVPVMQGDRLVGMLSLSDLLVRVAQMARAGDGVRPETIVQTLMTISSPNGDGHSERNRMAHGSPSSAPQSMS